MLDHGGRDGVAIGLYIVYNLNNSIVIEYILNKNASPWSQPAKPGNLRTRLRLITPLRPQLDGLAGPKRVNNSVITIRHLHKKHKQIRRDPPKSGPKYQ